MLVAPVPVFFLILVIAIFEIAMVAVGFTFPLRVKDYFVIVPAVIVVVIAVVDAVGVVFGAARQHDRGSKRGSQEKCG